MSEINEMLKKRKMKKKNLNVFRVSFSHTVVCDYINIMKMTFDFNFDL